MEQPGQEFDLHDVVFEDERQVSKYGRFRPELGSDGLFDRAVADHRFPHRTDTAPKLKGLHRINFYAIGQPFETGMFDHFLNKRGKIRSNTPVCIFFH
jgi:hypothetical protein